jgi:hypothetical protein
MARVPRNRINWWRVLWAVIAIIVVYAWIALPRIHGAYVNSG